VYLDCFRGSPLTGAARWHDGTSADQAVEVGGVGVEWAELGDGPSACRHDRSLA
jgi:hypothetical protein